MNEHIAINIMSWFILFSLMRPELEIQKIESKGLIVLHCIVINAIFILGIIGVANIK